MLRSDMFEAMCKKKQTILYPQECDHEMRPTAEIWSFSD